jgi:hypothetical protein
MEPDDNWGAYVVQPVLIDVSGIGDGSGGYRGIDISQLGQ